MSSFAEQLKAIQQKYEDHICKVVHTTVTDLAEVAIDHSPWGDYNAWSEESKQMRPAPPYVPGLFKGSWEYGHGEIPMSNPQTIDSSGNTSRERIAEEMYPASEWTIRFAADKHYLSNGTVYGPDMEAGAGLVGHNIGLGFMLEACKFSFGGIVEEHAKNGL